MCVCVYVCVIIGICVVDDDDDNTATITTATTTTTAAAINSTMDHTSSVDCRLLQWLSSCDATQDDVLHKVGIK